MKFSASIKIIGVNPYVELPKKILVELFENAGKDKSPIPVKLIIKDTTFVQNLVRFQGKWRLYLNTPMRQLAEAQVGDKISIDIAYDPKPRIEKMPASFKAALLKDKKINAVYVALTPSRKKEILRYLNSMKTDASLQRNIERIIGHLRGEEQPTLSALMRVPKK